MPWFWFMLQAHLSLYFRRFGIQTQKYSEKENLSQVVRVQSQIQGLQSQLRDLYPLMEEEEEPTPGTREHP